MSLRCKPGDLAVVVKSLAGNEGRIVRCLEFAGVVEFITSGQQPAWRIEPSIPAYPDGFEDVVADFRLRPIRDQDGEDETLSWSSLPSVVPQKEKAI